MEWGTNHMGDFMTSPQSDLFYFLDSITEGIYHGLLCVCWGQAGAGEAMEYKHSMCVHQL